MTHSENRLRGYLIAILAVVLFAPAPVDSQCAVTNTTPGFTSPSFIQIYKTLSMAGDCVTTMSNAFGCGRAPAASMATMLIASALPMSTMNPYCNWVCDCGAGYTAESISTGPADGLPVELMDFSIDDEDATGSLDTGGEDVVDRASR